MPDHSRWLIYITWILIVMGSAYILIPALQVESSLLSSFDDDAFYYFKIASNIASGHGSTFNGIHQTNGYHPLWMALLTGVWLVSINTAIAPLFLVKLLVIFLHAITIGLALLIVSAKADNRKFVSQISFLCLTSFFYIFIAQGAMEVALLIPLLILLIYQILQGHSVIHIAFIFLLPFSLDWMPSFFWCH